MELLAPAGNFEKLKAAILYGADAVYLAGHMFGMRSAADNFDNTELKEACAYAHERSVKVYLTLNTMPRDSEFTRLEEFLNEIKDFGIDAFIVADIGVMSLLRRVIPTAEIHISTQASVVNSEACRAYMALGAKRIVLSRELNIDEIKTIRANIPKELELEVFIHGSMCISYSGRCLISNHFVKRDANRGACTQPCRWNYRLYRMEEEKRPDDVPEIMQTDEGSFIFSSKDMCMIEHIPELFAAGVDSLKIEGRMKSAYYAAVVTNTYRMALDSYINDPLKYSYDPVWGYELSSVSHREYDTGYFFDDPMKDAKTVTESGYLREKSYIATALSYDPETKRATFLQKNKVISGQKAELMTPGSAGRAFDVGDMYNEEGEKIDAAPHPGMIFSIVMPFEVKKGDIIRGA